MGSGEARTTLAEAWTEAFTRVLETMTAATPATEWRAVDGPLPESEDGAEREWWSDGVSSVPGPSIWIGATAAHWKALGAWILAALGVEDAADEDAQSTCRDVVAQVASAFATELAKQLGTPLNSLGANPAGQPPESTYLVALETVLPSDSAKIPFAVAFQRALMEEAEETQQEAAAEAAPSLSEPIAELRFSVHARLGFTPVQLGDVFKWTVGSVVEIGRRITDPIDIVIGDRLIAKGQVVVSNSHYGARVTAIVHPGAEASS